MQGLIALVACLGGAAFGLAAAMLTAKPTEAVAPVGFPGNPVYPGFEAQAPETPAGSQIPAGPRTPAERAAALAMEANDILDDAHGRKPLLDQARIKLRAASAADPDEPLTLVVQARWQLMMGQGAGGYSRDAAIRAEHTITRALTLDPKLARAYVLRAHLYTATDRIALAKADLASAEALGYDRPWLLTNRAAIHEREGQHDQAAALYRQVIDQFGDDPSAVAAASSNLRAYHARRGEKDKAESYYRQQAELEPGNPWPHGNWAHELLYNFGDAEGAISRARQALVRMDYPQARRTLALALYLKWAELPSAERREAEPQFNLEEARRLMPDARMAAQIGRENRMLAPIAVALASTTRPQNQAPQGDSLWVRAGGRR